MKELLKKYSFGLGDRFAHQAKAQLKAIILAKKCGVEITPVWNKSYREHTAIGSKPDIARQQADLAVKDLNWDGPYFLDADHINLTNVDFFLDSCDFFTIDVANYIGKTADPDSQAKFINTFSKYCGKTTLPIINQRIEICDQMIQAVAEKYLFAIQEAGKIYRHIKNKKAGKKFVIEVSMDETDLRQTPVELFLVLGALSYQNIPLQTIAPKFSGRFNKGVDYVGDLLLFKQEFERDLAILKLASLEFGLPADIKLSIHSGSDKFSIYPIIRESINKFDAGLHVKTAGTSWLEELIGLAEAGGQGLETAKKVYAKSIDYFDQLCAPYKTVIDIDKSKLPSVESVNAWDGRMYSQCLKHDQENPNYNLHFRQLLHVGYKIAAKLGDEYLDALKQNEEIIAKNVTENIFERHIKPLFL